MFPVFIKIKKL